MLHVCTLLSGADVLVVDNITIRFTKPENEFARNPVAHTCGCVLEIPETYASYMEFSEEFKTLLQSEVWIMDIV